MGSFGQQFTDSASSCFFVGSCESLLRIAAKSCALGCRQDDLGEEELQFTTQYYPPTHIGWELAVNR